MQRLKRRWRRCWIPSAPFANKPHAEENPQTPVGASLLAKNVNDNAGILVNRAVITFFASKLAPTKVGRFPAPKSRQKKARWGGGLDMQRL
ncbi:hypothetical protein CER19_01995 [Pseudomonas sp. GL93]|nr:hypothetical protein CER19_01995 [Pseudomonas sp. GL93]